MITRYLQGSEETHPEKKYIEVGADMLILGTRLPFDVFIHEDGAMKHIFGRGMIYTKHARALLTEKNVANLYIDESEKADLDSYLKIGAFQKIITDKDPELFRAYSAEKDKYHQIDRNILIHATDINFNLYLLDELTFAILLETTGDKPVKFDKNLLPYHGDILIRKSDLYLLNDYLQSILQYKERIPAEKTLKVKAMVIRENSKVLMEELLEDPLSGDMIQKTNTSVNSIIDTILDNKEAVYDLIDMSKRDYYTYTHSVNVAVMTIGLGSAIGLDRGHIEELGMGAMLHDIGKSAVPAEILNKQGRLDFIEYRIMKEHVVEGERILRMHRDFPEESFPAVLQHHEKLTGKGYPFGISGKELKLYGRITSVVDCYDALTTNRPYKTAYTPFYAFYLLIKEKQAYDSHIVREFIKMIGKVK